MSLFYQNVSLTNITWVLTTLSLYLIFSYFWKKRWMYYHAFKIPGPIALPIFRNFKLLVEEPNPYKMLTKFCAEYFPVARSWLDTLYVYSSRPEDVETVLTRCLDKGEFYFFANDYFKDTIIFAPIPLWKKQRRILNDFLKPKIIDNFDFIMLRETKRLCDCLEEGKSFDAFLKMWQLGTNVACETIGGVNPRALRGKKQSILDILKYEKLVLQRVVSIFLQSDFLWNLSSLKREVTRIVKRASEFSEKMFQANLLEAQNIQLKNEEDQLMFKNCLLTNLIEANEENNFSKELLLRISGTLLPISSETTAVALSSTLLLLGMHQQIQAKVYDELFSIFGTSKRDPTKGDLSHMDYLERVIKESLRLFPPVTFFLREVDQDVTIGSYILPRGTRFFVFLDSLHRNPNYWPHPLMFDPDRFLPERAKMRPRCAYMPFSIGSRNCPGAKYAMLLMKIALSTILRRYKIAETPDYKTVEDIKLEYAFVGKAIKGYIIKLEKIIE